ncbi:malectin/receptor-like protein kinase family protein [Actinidia rufa]|uniref:Malectin/receptor-like protein kinase family protein n=1 Tax=Actinidia rufa TaxID=165716 RepID=A0A7J0EL42_9ERIC|nr:malectin/receptor-like protein kinase family protein [Actinidia rufa]
MSLCPLPIIISLSFCLHHLIIPVAGAIYYPLDNIAVNCGLSDNSTAADGRQWIGDNGSKYITSHGSKGKLISSIAVDRLLSPDPVPYKTARVSRSQFTYTFQVQGLFYGKSWSLYTLLSNFSAALTSDALGLPSFAKEFCANVEENQRLIISFIPSQGSSADEVYAFVNGIEVVSMPTGLYHTLEGEEGAHVVSKKHQFSIDKNIALEKAYRLNVGGSSILSLQDTGCSSRRYGAPAPNRVGNGVRTRPHTPFEDRRVRSVSATRCHAHGGGPTRPHAPRGGCHARPRAEQEAHALTRAFHASRGVVHAPHARTRGLALPEVSRHSGFIRGVGFRRFYFYLGEALVSEGSKERGRGQGRGHHRGTGKGRWRSQARGRTVRCFYCDQEGYIKRDCPKYKAQVQSSDTAATAVMAVDKSEVLLAASDHGKSDWFPRETRRCCGERRLEGYTDWRGVSRQEELLSDMGPVVLARRVDKGSNRCTEVRKASAGVPEGSGVLCTQGRRDGATTTRKVTYFAAHPGGGCGAPRWGVQGTSVRRCKHFGVEVHTLRYLLRFHFCELEYEIKENENTGFSIFVNEEVAEAKADITEWSGRNGVAVYKDYVVMMEGDRMEGKRDLVIALCPHKIDNYDWNEQIDAILKGLEVFKLSNPDKNLAGVNPVPLVRASTSGKPNPRKLVFALGGNAIATGVVVLLTVVNIIVYKLRILSEKVGEKDLSSLPSEGLCCRFSLAEILSVTNNFDDELVVGRGGFGKVYKAVIDGGETSVSIKRLNLKSRQGADEFWTEIEMLSNLRHTHLVSLKGYCDERSEMILVYEYMEYGTLADHLYKINTDVVSGIDEDQRSPVLWAQQCMKEKTLDQIIHPILRDQITPKHLMLFAEVAIKCLHSRPNGRPTMADVVVSLECALASDDQCRVSSSEEEEDEEDINFAGAVDELIDENIQEYSVLPVASIPSTSTPWDNALRQYRCFSIMEIREATHDFHEDLKIGEGGFSKVYRGWIDNRTLEVAIKRLKESGPGQSLCFGPSTIIFIQWIVSIMILFPGRKRLEICIGAAMGLQYLHSETTHTIIHHDIRPTKILLDENWVLCARKPYDYSLDEDQKLLVRWFGTCVRGRTIDQVIDPYLVGRIAPDCLREFVKIAWKCVLERGAERPSMDEVVGNLQIALQLQQNWHYDIEFDNESHNDREEQDWFRFATARAYNNMLSYDSTFDTPNTGSKFGVLPVTTSIPIKYTNIPTYIAPQKVYQSVWSMDPNKQTNKMCNLTWKFPVDLGFGYHIRLHFCEPDFGVKESGQREDYVVMIEGNRKEGKRDLIIALQPQYNESRAKYHTGAVLNRCLQVEQTLTTVLLLRLQAPGTRHCSYYLKTPDTIRKNVSRFSLSEIQMATNNFDDELVIGDNGFGMVYKGLIDEGATIVAVKRLKSMSKQGAQEFWTENKMLSNLQHTHLVTLIGYCNESQEVILVYEYMVHSTLADHPHRISRNGVGSISPLSWEQRLNICIGAAQAADEEAAVNVSMVVKMPIDRLSEGEEEEEEEHKEEEVVYVRETNNNKQKSEQVIEQPSGSLLSVQEIIPDTPKEKAKKKTITKMVQSIAKAIAKPSPVKPDSPSSSHLPPVLPCRRFSLTEVQADTNNFHRNLVIKYGSPGGEIYIGYIDNRKLQVAIERCTLQRDIFLVEVEMRTRFHHLHMVSFIGHCKDSYETILVYEYMSIEQICKIASEIPCSPITYAPPHRSALLHLFTEVPSTPTRGSYTSSQSSSKLTLSSSSKLSLDILHWLHHSCLARLLHISQSIPLRSCTTLDPLGTITDPPSTPALALHAFVQWLCSLSIFLANTTGTMSDNSSPCLDTPLQSHTTLFPLHTASDLSTVPSLYRPREGGGRLPIGHIIVILFYLEITLSRVLDSSRVSLSHGHSMVEICIGAAQQLQYLHSNSKEPIIHGNLKSTSIFCWMTNGFSKLQFSSVDSHFVSSSKQGSEEFGALVQDLLSKENLRMGADQLSMDDVMKGLQRALHHQETAGDEIKIMRVTIHRRKSMQLPSVHTIRYRSGWGLTCPFCPSLAITVLNS